MEKVLARRYRPQTFAEVIGQEAVVRTLRNALAAGRVAHGFIFSGHRGIGKTTVARLLAKAMNCRRAPGPTAEPCGECESCREIRDGNAVDVIEIDAASNRGIDEIRALRENVRYRPARDRYKFYILDEAHQLTDDAFNALLKTLEEPPEWAIFVLATTEPEALPATIRSRCQHFAFRAVPYAQLVARLEQVCAAEGLTAEPEALALIGGAAEGSLRDALSLLDQAIAYAGGAPDAATARALLGRVSAAELGALLGEIAAAEGGAALARLEALLAAGSSPAQFCRQFVLFLRNLLLATVAGVESELLAVGEVERRELANAAGRFGEEDLTRFVQILLRAAADMRFSQEPRLHLELALMKMAQAGRLASLETLLAELSPSGQDTSEAAGSRGGATPPESKTAEKKTLSAAAGIAISRASGGAISGATSEAAATTRAGARTEPLPSTAGPAPVGAPVAATVAAPAASSAARPAGTSGDEPLAAGSGGDSPRDRVLALLARRKQTSWLSSLSRAEWRWNGPRLELSFYGEAAPLAGVAGHPELLKELREACREVLGRAPEVSVRAEAEGAAAGPSSPPNSPPAPVSELAERAARHPVLRAVRERLPTKVLRTAPLEGGGE